MSRYPWYQSWVNAKRRCEEPGHNRYQYYGAKGIEFKLSTMDMEKLYERDRVDLMRKPQLHRKKDTKNYTFKNCEFIEASEHSRLTHLGKKRSKESRLRMSLAGGTQFGEKHPQAKLNFAEVEAIRVLIGTLTLQKIADMYGVSKSTIYAIKHRKIWRKNEQGTY